MWDFNSNPLNLVASSVYFCEIIDNMWIKSRFDTHPLSYLGIECRQWFHSSSYPTSMYKVVVI